MYNNIIHICRNITTRVPSWSGFGLVNNQTEDKIGPLFGFLKYAFTAISAM